jgi:hypothetical protein
MVILCVFLYVRSNSSHGPLCCDAVYRCDRMQTFRRILPPRGWERERRHRQADTIWGGNTPQDPRSLLSRTDSTPSYTPLLYEGVSKSFRTESITKYTTINTRWEASQGVMVANLTRLTHKIAIKLHLVAQSCTICSSRSRRPVRKLLDTSAYLCPLS